jgi:SpoVK/Ycf46/Vps4 family AAA+-type ATPase
MKDAIFIEVDKLLKRITNLYLAAENYAKRENYILANETLNKTSDDIDSILKLVITDNDQNVQLESLLEQLSSLKKQVKEEAKIQAKEKPFSAFNEPDHTNSPKNQSKSDVSENRVEELASSSDYTIIENTGVTFDDVIGCEEIKAFISQDWIFRFNADYQQVTISDKTYTLFDPKSMERGILFYGLPGTGKTMIAKAIASKVKATFFSIDASQLLDKYKGGTVQRMKQLFEEASRYERAIIFIDEIDSILMKQSDSTEQHSKQDLNQWLALMNGINSNKKYDHLMFIGTTNDPNSIAPAALRPGRFGLHFRLDIPDAITREALISKIVASNPMYSDMIDHFDIKKAAALTSGYTQADITALLSRLLNLIKGKIITNLAKRIDQKTSQPSKFEKNEFIISQDEVEEFIRISHKTSTESILNQLENFEEEFNIKPLAGGIREHYAKIIKEGGDLLNGNL